MANLEAVREVTQFSPTPVFMPFESRQIDTITVSSAAIFPRLKNVSIVSTGPKDTVGYREQL